MTKTLPATKSKFTSEGIELHPPEDFEGMRKAGRLAAEILDMITDHVAVGVTTDELDRLCHNYCTKAGAIPAPLGYMGSSPIPFPKSICTSINEVVCHGIPSERKLRDKDIINIDVTVILNGWHGDSSRMYMVGNIDPKASRLVNVTYDCMMAGIEAVRPGATLGDIGKAIEKIIPKKDYSIVRDFCGHGLGRVFHAPPSVMHFYESPPPESKSKSTNSKTKHPSEIILEPGMFFTIEPMINEGKDYRTKILDKDKKGNIDGWTARTTKKRVDGKYVLSAQFEHSLAVTETGYEIFTLSPKGYTKPPYIL